MAQLQLNATGNDGPTQGPAGGLQSHVNGRHGSWLLAAVVPTPQTYLIQELSRLLGQRVVGKHAVVTIDAVPSRVV